MCACVSGGGAVSGGWSRRAIGAGACEKGARRKAAPPSKAAEQPKFKAIWEPVNYSEDVKLTDVHFVSAEEGWAVGGKNALAGGVIIHTKDAGKTWEVQLGDPGSSDRAYNDLRFIDATHGWAVQRTGVGDHKLLRTTDGQNWMTAGTVPQHRTDYIFADANTGFATSRDKILRTADGGKTWKDVYTCRIKAEVNGLTRDVSCQFATFYFPNARVGYAVSQEFERGAGSVLARTDDGGMTWKAWPILPGENARESALFFSDEMTGVLRTIGAKLFRTTDGGQTWTGVPAEAPGGKPQFSFADGQVGWMVRYNKMAWTTDGGQHWNSRDIAFPATVEASCLPQRDRGYAVGEHGMVYRYRIVPIEYTAKGMLAAPAIASASR